MMLQDNITAVKTIFEDHVKRCIGFAFAFQVLGLLNDRLGENFFGRFGKVVNASVTILECLLVDETIM